MALPKRNITPGRGIPVGAQHLPLNLQGQGLGSIPGPSSNIRDPQRIQTRIDFLQKYRPNDPEINQLISRMGGGFKMPNMTGQPVGPVTNVPVQGGGAEQGQPPPVNDPRIQQRIDFLMKTRPNDPEIQMLISKMGGGFRMPQMGGFSPEGQPMIPRAPTPQTGGGSPMGTPQEAQPMLPPYLRQQ